MAEGAYCLAVSPSKLIYRFKIAVHRGCWLLIVPGVPKVLSAASGISHPIRTASECIGVDRLPITRHERACLNKNDGSQPISGVGVTAVTVLVLATLIDLVVSAGSVSPDMSLILNVFSPGGILCSVWLPVYIWSLVCDGPFVCYLSRPNLSEYHSPRHETSAC